MDTICDFEIYFNNTDVINCEEKGQSYNDYVLEFFWNMKTITKILVVVLTYLLK